MQIIYGIVLIVLLAGAWQGAAEETDQGPHQPVVISGLAPARELSDDKGLKPGLSVIYIYKFFRYIDQMPILDPKTTTEKIGKPIPFLNHHFSEQEPVFDSGVSRGIGMQMNGFLKFSKPGSYGMMALSNDGIRIQICGKIVLVDPNVHSDRLSPQAILEITKPGWYPVMIQYFQRKGTSAIALHWKLPGENDFQNIPAEAYAREAVSKGAQ